MIADAAGRAVALRVAPGQAHELPHAVPLLDRLPGVSGWVVADRGYASQAFREHVWGRGARPAIPAKRNKAPVACYTCPGGHELRRYWQDSREAKAKPPSVGIYRYRARKADCDACDLKQHCRPGEAGRKVLRSIHEPARDVARQIATTEAYLVSRRERKRVEMLFAHLKRILKLDRLRLRGPHGARDEFLMAATAQNLRKLAKLIPMPAAAAA